MEVAGATDVDVHYRGPNRCQSLISGIMSWALDEGRINAHPALRIRRCGEERSRDIVMSAEKLRAFWTDIEQAHANATLAMRVLLLVGCDLRQRQRTP